MKPISRAVYSTCNLHKLGVYYTPGVETCRIRVVLGSYRHFLSPLVGWVPPHHPLLHALDISSLTHGVHRLWPLASHRPFLTFSTRCLWNFCLICASVDDWLTIITDKKREKLIHKYIIHIGTKCKLKKSHKTYQITVSRSSCWKLGAIFKFEVLHVLYFISVLRSV